MTTNELTNSAFSETQNMSKRELKKWNQTLRLIEKETNLNEKSHKRNGQHYRKANDPTPRKILKTQALSNADKSDNNSSSVKDEMKNENNSSPKLQKNIEQTEKKIYNTAYNVQGGQSGLFNYILSYNYNQKNVEMEMQDENWDCLQQIGEESLKTIQNEACKEATKKMLEKLSQNKEKLQYPYSRQHKDFNKKYLNKSYLIGS